jgi:hypothetical protein
MEDPGPLTSAFRFSVLSILFARVTWNNRRRGGLIIIMPDHANRTSPTRPTPYPAEKARGGEIILRRPWQRAVFILGLAAPLVLLLLLFLVQR